MTTITLFDTAGEQQLSRAIVAKTVSPEREPQIIVQLRPECQLSLDEANARALYLRLGYQLEKLQGRGAA